MRTLGGVKAGVSALLVAAVVTAVAGCTSTVGGVATCPGCGINAEPSFPTGRPTVSSPTSSTSAPPTAGTPAEPAPGGATLSPNESGYVYIETKSGATRCQISSESVGCEAEFTNTPTLNGEPANGVEVSTDGSIVWHVGNLGDIPTTTIDYATYHAVGWTIEASSAGTRFTNDATGHGMSVSIDDVSAF